jgi:hypothetical protein
MPLAETYLPPFGCIEDLFAGFGEVEIAWIVKGPPCDLDY